MNVASQERVEYLERLLDELLKVMARKDCHNCRGEGTWRHQYCEYASLCSCVKQSLLPHREN